MGIGQLWSRGTACVVLKRERAIVCLRLSCIPQRTKSLVVSITLFIRRAVIVLLCISLQLDFRVRSKTSCLAVFASV